MPPDIQILVVDDESNIVVLCQHLLELASYRVITATDPISALKIIQQQKIDLLLTDIRLPEMDGFELINHAREQQPDLAIVVMTGYRTVETAIRALRSGVHGLVIKPYELGPELLDIIRQAIEENQTRQTSIRFSALQPLLKLGNLPLLESANLSLENLVVQTIVDSLKPVSVGVYAWSAAAGKFNLLDRSGQVPEEQDDFWTQEAIQKVYNGEAFVRLMATRCQPSSLGNYLEAKQWGGVMAVSLKRRKEHYLFLAVREADSPCFVRLDLDLFTAIARQAAMNFENARHFNQLSWAAQRMERSTGLLQRAERMSALESLLPGLIHEINNPLQAIKNSLYLAGRSGISVERMRDHFNTAQKELYRLEMVLQRLLALNQPACEDLTAVSLDQLLTHVLDLFQLKFKEASIQARLNIARPVPSVQGVRDQLEMVLLILVQNAVESFEADSADRQIWLDLLQEDGLVKLMIEDNGTGLSEQAEENLFKPFFTTKPGGTGFGLVLAQRIAEIHGGRITRIAPQRGSGACFQIEFPASA